MTGSSRSKPGAFDMMSDARGTVLVTWPDWIHETVTFGTRYDTDEDRMRLAIELARQNVLHSTGGPFGAAIFEHSMIFFASSREPL